MRNFPNRFITSTLILIYTTTGREEWKISLAEVLIGLEKFESAERERRYVYINKKKKENL